MGKHSPRYNKRRWWHRYMPRSLACLFEILKLQRGDRLEVHIHYHFADKAP